MQTLQRKNPLIPHNKSFSILFQYAIAWQHSGENGNVIVSQLHMGTPAEEQTQDNTEFRSSDPSQGYKSWTATFAGLRSLEKLTTTTTHTRYLVSYSRITGMIRNDRIQACVFLPEYFCHFLAIFSIFSEESQTCSFPPSYWICKWQTFRNFQSCFLAWWKCHGNSMMHSHIIIALFAGTKNSKKQRYFSVYTGWKPIGF